MSEALQDLAHIDVSGSDEEITEDWVAKWTVKEPYVFQIPDTYYFLYEEKSGLKRGLWSLYRLEEDGEETPLGSYELRGELRRVLAALTCQDAEGNRKGGS